MIDEDKIKRILMHAAAEAIAAGEFDVHRVIPPRTDAPPRPDLSIPGEASKWWIVPPHTGLEARMLPPAQPLKLSEFDPKDFNRSTDMRLPLRNSWTS